MPDPNDQILGMDASGFRDEIKNVVIPTINDLNAQSDKLAKILDKVGEGLEDTTFAFTQADKSGNKYGITISSLEGKFERTVRLLNLNNDALQKNADIHEAAARQVLHTVKGEEEYNKQLDKKIKKLTEARDAVSIYTTALENNKKIQDSLVQQDKLQSNQIIRQGGEFSESQATVRRKDKYRNSSIGEQGPSASSLQSAQELDAVESSIKSKLIQELALADSLGSSLERQSAEAAALDKYAASLEQKYIQQISAATQLNSKLTESRVQNKLRNESDAQELAQLKRQEVALERQKILYDSLESAAARRNQQDALHLASIERNTGGEGQARIRSYREPVDLGSGQSQYAIQSEEELLAIKVRINTEDERAEIIGQQLEANILRMASESKLRQETEAKIATELAAQQQATRLIKSELIDARVQSDLELKTLQEQEAIAHRIAQLRARQVAQLAQMNAAEETRIKAQKDSEALARRSAADDAGLQIRKSVPTGLDPETLVRANTAIGQITSAIAKGQITAQEALKTFTAVEKGEATAFEGAAARVANASARILSVQNQSSGKTPTNTAVATSPLIDLQNRLAKAFQETETAGVRSATSIFLSWNQLAKLFLIQSLHTIVRKFFGALSDTISVTEQFQIKISEIRTISQDAQQTTEEWAKQIRGLSNAFGVPTLEVAEGLYQTISNQIAKGADATGFMTKALEFAKITVSSTSDAVNLLTSALNSFHASEDQTTYSAQILFKTIELGRVRASEMANSFGRLGAIAFPLGVQLDEVAASITTLTRRGIKYDEVQTLISNVMIRLLKPTAEMQKLFDKWGVSTGQAAIQAYGFVGVLRKLETETDSSAAEFADLFKNIRAIQGVLGLTGGAFEQYENDLAQLREKSAKDAGNALGITFESAGAQLKKSTEQIKNYFGEEFGDLFVNGVVKISNALSDEGLLGVVKSLTTATLVGGSAIAAYFASIAIGAQRARLSAFWTTAQTTATLSNTNANRLLILAEEELAVADALESGTAQLLSLDHTQLIATYGAQEVAVQNLTIAEEEYTLVQNLQLQGRIVGTEALELDRQARINLTAATIELETVSEAQNATQARANLLTEEAIAVHDAEALSLQQTALASGNATAATVAARSAFGRLAGILVSPAFLFTAAIGGITYFLYRVHEESKEIAEAWQKAHDVAVEQNQKITREIEEELAKRERTFKDSLTRQYAEFAAFGAGIGKQLTKIRDYYIDSEKQAVDSTKEAIRLTLQEYDNSTRKIEEYYRRSLDNIRKLEEDLDKSRDDFANKQLARQLKLAELKDAEAIPGKAGVKLIDENQIDLLNKRKAAIKAENQELAARSNTLQGNLPTVGDAQRGIDTKEIEENNKRVQANYAELEALENKFFEKRIALEAQHKKTQEDLVEAEKKLREEAAVDLAKQAENQAKDKKEAEGREFAETESGLQKTKNKKLKLAKDDHRDEKNSIQDVEDKARKDKENLENAERKRTAEKHVQDLKARSQAEDASLKASPTLAGYDVEFKKLNEEKLKAINDQIKAEENLTKSVEAELETRKRGIEPLHTALKEIEAFKTDNPAIKTEGDLSQRLGAFDALINKAKGAGLDDQGLLQKFVEERTAIERKGKSELAGLEKANLEQQLINNKSGYEKEFNERKRYIEELHKYNDQLLSETSGTLGTKGKEGSLKTESQTFFADIPPLLVKYLDAMNLAQEELKKAEQNLALNNTPVSKEIIDNFKDAIANFDSAIPQDHRIRSTQVGESSVGEQIQALKDHATQLEKNVNLQNTIITESALADAKHKANIDVAEQQVAALNKQYGFLDSSANNAAKSVNALDKELIGIIEGMQRLKGVIDTLQPPAGAAPPQAIPAKGHAAGGYIFAPKGTDTVPAMLTPGEFVINARAARAYRRELEQINYYEDGGLVGERLHGVMPEIPDIESNNQQFQFGDFHYHGQMTGNQKADAKAVFYEIQNMIRRGELTANNSQSHR